MSEKHPSFRRKVNLDSLGEKLNSTVDLSLIEFNLSLSFEERLINHQRALETIHELLKARKQIYGESKPSSETPA